MRAVDTLTRTEPDRARTIPRGALFRRTLSETPRRLTLIGAAVAALVVAFAAVLASGASSARGALSTLSTRTAEVSALNDLYFRLNDMDAQAANLLLVGFQPTIDVPTAVNAQASTATYESDRAAASADLERIALNPALAAQYTKLLTALGGYEGLIAQAMYLDQNSGPQQPAAPPTAALALYTDASGQMHSAILPIARDITTSDTSDVNGTYSGDRGGVQGLAIAVVAVALLLAIALLAAHRTLGRRFHRMLTPALAAATIVTLAIGGLGFSLLQHEADQLKIAKVDAFDSINALTNACAVSYDANADESRWLLEHSTVQQNLALQLSFFTKASQVASVSGVNPSAAATDPSSYYSGLNQATQTLSLDAAANQVSNVHVGGLLGAELNNVTFPDEAQSAFTTAKNFNAYVHTDETIRADAARKDYASAVKLDIGTTPGYSNYAFYQYDTALQSVIKINEDAFNAAIDDGVNSLSVWTWLPYAAAAAVLALTAAALYPRLREYR